MPRVYTFVAAVVPLVAILYVFRTLDVAARLQLSWPLAVHPDGGEDAAQLHLRPETPAPAVPPSDAHSQPSGHHGHVKGSFTRRIVAVGDLHGDLENAYQVLHMAGVVDENGDWSGGVDFFVQTGDIVDRGDDTIKLYAWMDSLRDQAHEKGGTVLTHLGNHEWMNVIGDWRYVHKSEIKTFGTAEERMQKIMTGIIGKSWAANYSTTSRLPLHSSLGPPNTDYDPEEKSPLSHAAVSFVHGGLAPTYPDLTPFPSRINELSHTLLHKLQHRTPAPLPHPPHAYPGLPHSATVAEQRLYAADGPLWYRGWALDPEAKACAAVDDVLQQTGTRRMIMGHTPDFERIVARCGGKIIIIDTGISHAYGGVLSALSINYTLTPLVASSDSKERRWKEREVVTALYMDHQDVLAVSEREVSGDF